MTKALTFAILFSVCSLVVASRLNRHGSTKPVETVATPESPAVVIPPASLYAMQREVGNAMMSGDYATASDDGALLRDELSPNALAEAGAKGNVAQYIYQTQLITAVRFGKWEEALRNAPLDTLTYASLLSHFARGMALARAHDPEAADDELELLEAALTDPVLREASDTLAAVYAPGTIARQILEGVIAIEKKRYRKAISAFEEAIVTEDALINDKLRYWLLPARQYLGDLYLQMKEYPEAIQVFKEDFRLNPGNIWALQGLMLAYMATNDATGIKSTQQKMAEKYSGRKIERPVF